MEWKENPVINSDFPDPDIIRVGDTYYMASTTMHYMPGCDILRSYDLMNWEFFVHVYETLDDTPGHRLDGKNHIYGQGMWAPSLTWHEGIFYVIFSANDTHKTYLFHANNPAGPWEKQIIEGFYYDSSLFFDEDGCIYIVHGNTELLLTQLSDDLSGPLTGGMNRVVARDREDADLGYEGSHLYKKDGRYYLFTCHMARGERKSEVCFVADSLEREFRGKCIINDDGGYYNLGVAQGGMVDTPEGDWYLFMFQDRGALGRAPMLMPCDFDEDGYPVLDGREHGKPVGVPRRVNIPSTRPGYVYEPLNGDDDFNYQPDTDGRVKLKPFWQFCHNPVSELWTVTERAHAFRLYSGKVCDSLVYAYNTLTQRTFGPQSSAWVTVDGSGLKDGDYAGICAFLGCYGAIALNRDGGKYYLVMLGKPPQNDTVFGDKDFTEPAVEYARIPVDTDCVTLKAYTDFREKRDEATFYWQDKDKWKTLGITQKQFFKMDHFTGCRFALFLFSTKQTGGHADFMKFRYRKQ